MVPFSLTSEAPHQHSLERYSPYAIQGGASPFLKVEWFAFTGQVVKQPIFFRLPNLFLDQAMAFFSDIFDGGRFVAISEGSVGLRVDVRELESSLRRNRGLLNVFTHTATSLAAFTVSPTKLTACTPSVLQACFASQD